MAVSDSATPAQDAIPKGILPRKLCYIYMFLRDARARIAVNAIHTLEPKHFQCKNHNAQTCDKVLAMDFFFNLSRCQ